MTMEQMSKALHMDDLRSMTKFLLVIIADQTMGDGCARTDMALLSRRTCMTADSVERSLGELELAGHIRILARNGKGRLVIRCEL